MEQLQLTAPEGYKYKLVLVKKGLTDAQKRAMNKYEAKNKVERDAKRAAQKRDKYNNDEEHRNKIKANMRSTTAHKKIMAELPNL